MTNPGRAYADQGGAEFIQGALERLGLAEVQQHVAAAREHRGRGVQLLERNEKGSQLGIGDLGGQQAAEDWFASARRHLQQAYAASGTNLARPEWAQLAQTLDEHAHEMTPSLDEYRRRLAQLLADNRIPPADAAEMMASHDEVAAEFRSKGAAQLMRQLHDRLGEGDGLLTSERNFGRDHRSPITVYDYWDEIINTYIGLYAVWLCYVTAMCWWLVVLVQWYFDNVIYPEWLNWVNQHS